ncbi:hypothetical protein niasHT_038279 [Heterodera trifolii]|uniref:Uncharacterized protein n=1 Tax=Heterodera trifolii TaxID=157864 RepID=A0ABD2HRM6_9BILA
MIKSFLFRFSLFAFATNCVAGDSLIDPVEVKHLAQFLRDFSNEFCDQNDPIAFCLATQPNILDTFYEELKHRRKELLKREKSQNGGQLLLFVELEKLLKMKELSTAYQRGGAICRFAANVLQLFVVKARELGTSQKELLESKRGLSETVYEQYQTLFVVYDECVGDLRANVSDGNSRVTGFNWELESEAELGSLKLDELAKASPSFKTTKMLISASTSSTTTEKMNPIEIKLLAQLMLDFAVKSEINVMQIVDYLKNPFVSSDFHELLAKINKEKSEFIKKGSFIDQLNTFAKNNANANVIQFGQAVGKFFLNILVLFINDAKSDEGKAMLRNRGVEEKEIDEYGYLEFIFRAKIEESKMEKNTNEIGNELLIKNRSAKFLWEVIDIHQAEYSLKLKFPKIIVNTNQLSQFIRDGIPIQNNCESQIDQLLTLFTNKSNQNAIFKKMVEVWDNVLLISRKVGDDDKKKRQILCSAFYVLNTLITAAKGKSNSQQFDELEQLVQPSNKYYLDLANSFQKSANAFNALYVKGLESEQLNIRQNMRFYLMHIVPTTELLALLSVADLCSCLGILALGLMRKALYERIVETSQVPLETIWSCASKPFVFLRLIGVIVPPWVILWISAERFMAVLTPKIYCRHIFKR